MISAIFAMVLNRLLCPCSKRRVSRWSEEVEEPAFQGLSLHHFYRTLDVPWENKGRLEEDLFRRRQDLFSQGVDFVFFDTTTVSFQGEGPEGLAEYGYSRGKRPDLKQTVVTEALTREGMPIAPEVFPGSTADVRSFAQVITSLKERFPIERVVVSDRGTVSEKNLELLSTLELSWGVLGGAFGSKEGEGGTPGGEGEAVSCPDGAGRTSVRGVSGGRGEGAAAGGGRVVGTRV